MAPVAHRIERVQLGVRMESRLVKVLKGLAEFNDETLGELLEKIVPHSFEPVPEDEGESSASPHSKAQLKAIEDLKKVLPSSPQPTDPRSAGSATFIHSGIDIEMQPSAPEGDQMRRTESGVAQVEPETLGFRLEAE